MFIIDFILVFKYTSNELHKQKNKKILSDLLSIDETIFYSSLSR